MPLVRTAMSAPTKFYDNLPKLTPEEAAEFVVEAIVKRPVRVATKLGIFGQIFHGAMPHLAQIIMNTAFRMFPDSAAATEKPGKTRFRTLIKSPLRSCCVGFISDGCFHARTH